jgi:hypothetical protein
MRALLAAGASPCKKVPVAPGHAARDKKRPARRQRHARAPSRGARAWRGGWCLSGGGLSD